MRTIRNRTIIGMLLISLPIWSVTAADSMVLTTWNFPDATAAAWDILSTGSGSSLDAVERGCSVCEEQQCDFTVGFGGSPDEHGETSLDAMIMDGRTMNVGSVVAMRRIKPAISVARKVLDLTKHSILAGDLATEFAVQMGFTEESLSTNRSHDKWQQWLTNHCQPNFWTSHVIPDPGQSCGPYTPKPPPSSSSEPPTDEHGATVQQFGGQGNHDTIGMIAVDAFGNWASGTSTNGATFKIPGRVGDSPIPGAGSYADNEVGAAAATGDGDVMLRFLPSFLAVEAMRSGLSPFLAAKLAVDRITAKYPDFIGAVITANLEGQFGAACHGMKTFPFTVANTNTSGKVVKMTIHCTKVPTEPRSLKYVDTLSRSSLS